MVSALAAKVTEWKAVGSLEEAPAVVVAGEENGSPCPHAWQPQQT